MERRKAVDPLGHKSLDGQFLWELQSGFDS